MISIPGSLSFVKLVIMSSAPAKYAGDARYASQDPFNQFCPMKSRLQSVLGVRFFYVEHIKYHYPIYRPISFSVGGALGENRSDLRNL